MTSQQKNKLRKAYKKALLRAKKSKWEHITINRTGKRFIIFHKQPKNCSEPLIEYPSSNFLSVPNDKDWEFGKDNFAIDIDFKFLSIDGPNGLIINNNAEGATSCGPIFIQDDFLTSRFLIRR